MMVPTSDGLETHNFYPSNVAANNSAVAKLNARVTQINKDQQQKQDNEKAAKQAREQWVLAKEKATCAQVGGKWLSDNFSEGCDVTYNNSSYSVSFDDNGNIVPAYGGSAESCLAFNRTGWHNRWHSDTDICEMG